MQYTEKVMQHFMNPHNVGVIENPDGYGKVGNPSCGDIMEIFIKVDNDILTDVKFRTFGCASAIASSSISTDMIIGKTVDEAVALAEDFSSLVQGETVDEEPLGDAALLAGVQKFPARIKCATLAWKALERAVENEKA